MGTPPKAQPDDLLANIQLAIDRAADRINGQRSAADAIDAKALGGLALAAGGIATLAALSGVLAYWWLGGVLMGVSAVVLGYAVWPRTTIEAGPDPEEFQLEFGSAPTYDYHAQMLSDLAEAIDKNDALAARSRRVLKVGSVPLVLGIAAAVIAAIAHHH